MTAAATAAARAEEVRGRLALVDDPELDEPVTELGFITAVDVDPRGAVMIGFRLPTYWCAANFAFIMADDMRREVLALPWVRRVDVVLGDHMYADKINHGIAHGLSFQDTFGNEASGDVADIRRSFHLKAFQRRQEALLRHLLDTEHDPAALVAASLSELRTLPLNVEGNRLRARYLDRRQIPAPAGPGAPAFVMRRGGVWSPTSCPAICACSPASASTPNSTARCARVCSPRASVRRPNRRTASRAWSISFVKHPPLSNSAQAGQSCRR